jgi:hypothetical protein
VMGTILGKQVDARTDMAKIALPRRRKDTMLRHAAMASNVQGRNLIRRWLREIN